MAIIMMAGAQKFQSGLSDRSAMGASVMDPKVGHEKSPRASDITRSRRSHDVPTLRPFAPMALAASVLCGGLRHPLIAASLNATAAKSTRPVYRAIARGSVAKSG